ncbi:ANL family adenylate-forming protein [Citrobacter portucalensis]|uniref:ANL family adenylate-forming protein n=1 Tax=Citrobacter portucalensis TaxID=1639133 RepID=UPI00226BA822|nr:fatty acid--CoA ligase family protein [Citrobacter portucalensis]MCX8985933.1 fatty acid--CoA ligase family protein [Citrobacter portucalensis]
MNLQLIELMHARGDGKCIILDDEIFSYQDVANGIQQWVSVFSDYGIRSGAVVAIEGSYSLDMVTAMLALFSLDTIIVPISPNSRGERSEFYETAHVEWTLFIDVDVAAYTETWQLERRKVGNANFVAFHPLYEKIKSNNHPGLVLFSSGTTGRPKASLLDVDKIITRYTGSKKAQVILAFLNLDHIGGVNTLLHTLLSGGTLVTVAERNPRVVFEAIQNHRVQVLPTTPTFLNMILLSDVCVNFDTSSLELITYGTEPMPQQTLDGIKVSLPHVRLKQTYGLTELGIVPTQSRGNGSLWMKLGGSGFDYKIRENILWIKSNIAMLGYLNADSPIDSDGYFNTQDMVLVDGDYIQILGRKSEIINVGGEKVYPIEVENVLLTMPNVAAVRVSGYPSRIIGNVIQATFQLVNYEDIELFKKRVKAFCKQKLEPYKIPVVIEIAQSELHSERFKMIRTKEIS